MSQPLAYESRTLSPLNQNAGMEVPEVMQFESFQTDRPLTFQGLADWRTKVVRCIRALLALAAASRWSTVSTVT